MEKLSKLRFYVSHLLVCYLGNLLSSLLSTFCALALSLWDTYICMYLLYIYCVLWFACKTLTSCFLYALVCVLVCVTVITQWPANWIHIYTPVSSDALHYYYIYWRFSFLYFQICTLLGIYLCELFSLSHFLLHYNFVLLHFLLPPTHTRFVFQFCYFYTHYSRSKIILLHSKSISPQLIWPLHTLWRCWMDVDLLHIRHCQLPSKVTQL